MRKSSKSTPDMNDVSSMLGALGAADVDPNNLGELFGQLEGNPELVNSILGMAERTEVEAAFLEFQADPEDIDVGNIELKINGKILAGINTMQKLLESGIPLLGTGVYEIEVRKFYNNNGEFKATDKVQIEVDNDMQVVSIETLH